MIDRMASFSLVLPTLEDETLFSWCSRYHRLTANGLDRTTCQQLFGHARIGSAHDWPSRIDDFVTRTQCALGSAPEIIRARTLLPFYLPFRGVGLAEQAVTALQGSGIGPLKYRLGLLTSGLGAAHPLKACPQCIREDREQHGWSYWRRGQQLPGVWFCLEHRRPLQVSLFKSDSSRRFFWALPSWARCGEVGLLEWQTSGNAQEAWCIKLAKLCQVLVACLPSAFADVHQISVAFRQRLAELGVLNTGGRVRWPCADDVLEPLAKHLSGVPGLSHEANADLLRTQFSRLLSARTLTHSLRYAVWISAWFDDLEHFRMMYAKAGTDQSDIEQKGRAVLMPCLREPLNPLRSDALAEVRRGTLSLTAAAQRLGVAYETVAAWAAREHMVPPRRAKTIDAAAWQHAVCLLRQGCGKDDVAASCLMSVVSVTRILRSVPGLQAEWHQVRHELRRSRERQAWSELLGLQSQVGVKALRRLAPVAYAWLYRNDRHWLEQQSAVLPKRRVVNHSAVRIERADRRMAQALEKTALALHEAKRPLTLEALKRSVPPVARVVSSPEMWPESAKVLRNVLSMKRPLEPSLWRDSDSLQ